MENTHRISLSELLCPILAVTVSAESEKDATDVDKPIALWRICPITLT